MILVQQEKIILEAQVIVKKYKTVHEILKGHHHAQNLYIITYTDKFKLCFKNKSMTLITEITLLKKWFVNFEFDYKYSNYKGDIEPSYICTTRLKDFDIFMRIYKDNTLNLIIKENLIVNTFQVKKYFNINQLKTIYINDVETQEFINYKNLIFQVELNHLEILGIISRTLKKFSKLSEIEFFYDSKNEKLEIFLKDAPLPMKFSLNVLSYKHILEEPQLYPAKEWRFVFDYFKQFKKSRIIIKFYQQSAVIQIKDETILISSQIAKKVKISL